MSGGFRPALSAFLNTLDGARFSWALILAVVIVVGRLKSYAADFPARPFVLIDSNELAELRSEISHPGWKQAIYLTGQPPDFSGIEHAIKPNADLWLHRDIVIPSRGGHYHWFFCDDGTRLNLPTNQEFAPGPYRCPTCGRTYAGEEYESAVRRFVHQWLSLAARDLALVSAIEDKTEYAAKAGEVLCKYADAYPGPHTSLTEGGMVYQSLDEAMWVIPLAQAFDLIHDQLTPAQQTKITNFFKTIAGGLQRCGTAGNWGSWHLSAVGVIGYATEDASLVTWATKSFHDQIRDQLGDDGLWPESVQTYHFFPLMAFQFFAEAAWHAGLDLYHWEGKPGKSLARMYAAPLDYAYPNLQMAAINDGWYESFLPTDNYELAWHRLHDARFAWVLNCRYGTDRPSITTSSQEPNPIHRDSFYAFLFGNVLPTNAVISPPSSVNFPVMGIACLRSTNGAMMTFDYGSFRGHGQFDKMGVTFFADDKLWAADYGTPGYGAKILPWYRSTLAHNTIVVDDQDQLETKENAARLWLGKSFLEAVQSSTEQAYPGVRHARTVVRLGDCFIIRDQLHSRKTHHYDFYLHSEGSLQVGDGAVAGILQPSPSQWIQELHALPLTNNVSATWQSGDKVFSVCMIGGDAITPIMAKCPAETGAREVDLLIARQTSRKAEFITVLCPPGMHISLTKGNHEGVVNLTGSIAGRLKFPTSSRAPEFIRQ